MKKLNIVFTKSKKKFPVFSWLVMWWTKKPYSHVALSIEIEDWGKRYYQASEGKVNYEHETFFDKKHTIIKEYKLLIPKEIDVKIKKACYKEAGNVYGFMQDVGIALTDIYFKLFKKEKKNPWTRGRICSEIVYVECFKIMIPSLSYKENKIKPHHIEEIIKNNFSQDEAGFWILKMDSTT